MRVGIDFDNTLVAYDRLFHRIACEAGLIPPDLPVTKTAVRDHLRAIQREDRWTEMQGEVYGARMAEAEIFPGAREFLAHAQALGIETAVISHKTRYPYAGPKRDLHRAARDWIAAMLTGEQGPLIPPANVFFELTKDAKLARIGAWRCDYFIDDLTDILEAPDFPVAVAPILFSPSGVDESRSHLTSLESWSAIDAFLEAKAHGRA